MLVTGGASGGLGLCADWWPTARAVVVAAIASNPILNGETIRLDGAIRMAPR